MFWNDIKEIKDWMVKIDSEISEIKAFLVDMSEERDYSIERIHDKLNLLLEDERRKASVALAIKTLDKFEDYMKNVDKLNSMMNELKGCVSIVRSCVPKREKSAN